MSSLIDYDKKNGDKLDVVNNFYLKNVNSQTSTHVSSSLNINSSNNNANSSNFDLNFK